MTRHRGIDPVKVGGWAREVVARRALILIAVAAVAHVLVLTGAVPEGISEQAEAWATSILDALAAVVGVFWIRSGTTPADPALAPRSSNGLPLVESHWDEGGHVAPLRSAEREDVRSRLVDPE